MDYEQVAKKVYEKVYHKPPIANDQRLNTMVERVKEYANNPEDCDWPDKPPFSVVREMVKQEQYIETRVTEAKLQPRKMPGL